MIGGKFFVETKPYQYAKCWTATDSTYGDPCASAYNNYVAFTIGKRIEVGSFTSQSYTKLGTTLSPFASAGLGFTDLHAGAGNVAAITNVSGRVYVYNYSASLVTSRLVRFDSNNNDAELTRITRDSSGNIYLSLYGLDGTYGWVGGVAKFDSSYALQWASASYHGSENYSVYTVAVDNSGNSFAVGTTATTKAPILRRYDSSGNITHTVVLDIEIEPRVVSCSDGTDFYFAWTTTGNAYHVGKFTSGGSVSWVKSYTVSGSSAEIYGLTYSAADNTIVVSVDLDAVTYARGAFKITTAGVPVSGSALIMLVNGAGNNDHTGYVGYGANGDLFIPFTSTGASTDFQGIMSTTLSVPYAPLESTLYGFKNMSGGNITNANMTTSVVAGTATASSVSTSTTSMSLTDVSLVMTCNSAGASSYSYSGQESQLLVF